MFLTIKHLAFLGAFLPPPPKSPNLLFQEISVAYWVFKFPPSLSLSLSLSVVLCMKIKKLKKSLWFQVKFPFGINYVATGSFIYVWKKDTLHLIRWSPSSWGLFMWRASAPLFISILYFKGQFLWHMDSASGIGHGENKRMVVLHCFCRSLTF